MLAGNLFLLSQIFMCLAGFCAEWLYEIGARFLFHLRIPTTSALSWNSGTLSGILTDYILIELVFVVEYE